MKRIGFLFFCLMVFGAKASDCATCNQKEVPGSPGADTKLSSLVSVAIAANSVNNFSEDEKREFDKVCGQVNDLVINKNFSYVVEDKLKSYGNLTDTLSASYCTSREYKKIKIPMIQFAVDNSIARSSLYIQEIGSYYKEILQKPEDFKKLLNAKNDRKQTFLDYVVFIYQKMADDRPIDKNALEVNFYFACLNGGKLGDLNQDCKQNSLYSLGESYMKAKPPVKI